MSAPRPNSSCSTTCASRTAIRPAITRSTTSSCRAIRAANMMAATWRSEEHTSELQSLMRISYAVFCLKKKKIKNTILQDIDEINQIKQDKRNKYAQQNTHNTQIIIDISK